MKIMVIGSGGMLGQALVVEALSRGHEVVCVGRHHADLKIDVTDDSALRGAILSTSADLLVNCAAIVDIALCDQDPLLAWHVNARCVGVMAETCRSAKVRFVQVSTDHYFTGGGFARHDESIPVTLVNEYARTKYASEAFALICPDHLILRTNIVGFRVNGAPTFAEWAYESVENDAEMTLFEDSFVSSISVEAFSRSLLDLAESDSRGLYNLASSDVFSKHQFVKAIADSLGVRLTRATTGSVRSLQVSRAESCGLDVSKAQGFLGYRLPGLLEVVDQLTKKWKQSCRQKKRY